MKNADGMYVTQQSYVPWIVKGLTKTRYRWVEVWLGVFFPLRQIYLPGFADEQLERLEKLETLDGLKHREEGKELGRAYKMLWAANSDEQDKKLQVLAFRLILCAYTPLKPQNLVEALRFDPDKPENYELEIDLPRVEGLYHNFLRTDSRGFLDFEHMSAKAFVLDMRAEDNKSRIFSDVDNHRAMMDISLKLMDRPEHQLWQCGGIQLRQWQSQLSDPDHFTQTEMLRQHFFTDEGVLSSLDESGLRDLGETILFGEHFSQYLLTHWTRHCHRTCLEDRTSTVRVVAVLQNPVSGFQGSSLALGILYQYESDPGFETRFGLHRALYDAYDALCRRNFGAKTMIEAHPLLAMASFGISPCREYNGRMEKFLPVTANDMMIRNLDGDTVLHVASRRQESHTIRDILMLEKSLGCHLETSLLTSRSSSGMTPFAYVISGHRSVEVIKTMLEFEAEYAGLSFPPQPSDSRESKLLQSYLYSVILRADSDLCHWLLQRYAVDVNQIDGYGMPLLYSAVLSEKLTVAQFLLDNGADVDARGISFGTALTTAAYRGHLEMVRLLLERGAGVEAQGSSHETPLHAAAYRGSLEVVRLLLEKGADANAQGGPHGTPLHAAAHGGSLEVVRLLLEKGADVNAQGGRYGTALNEAAYRRSLEIVRLLLEKGADVNAQGGPLGTALQTAVCQGSFEIAWLLLESGANVNAKTGEYGSALKAAREYRNEESAKAMAELLLSYGAKG